MCFGRPEEFVLTWIFSTTFINRSSGFLFPYFKFELVPYEVWGQTKQVCLSVCLSICLLIRNKLRFLDLSTSWKYLRYMSGSFVFPCSSVMFPCFWGDYVAMHIWNKMNKFEQFSLPQCFSFVLYQLDIYAFETMNVLSARWPSESQEGTSLWFVI